MVIPEVQLKLVKTYKVERHPQPCEIDERAEGVEPPVLEPPAALIFKYEDDEEDERNEEDDDGEAAHAEQDVVGGLRLVQGGVVLLAGWGKDYLAMSYCSTGNLTNYSSNCTLINVTTHLSSYSPRSPMSRGSSRSSPPTALAG